MTTEVADAKLLRRHRELVAIIDENLEAFARTGLALKAIQEEKTYEAEGYDSFASFLGEQKRWPWTSLRHAQRLIAAAELRQALPAVSDYVRPVGRPKLPEWTEWQVRELTRLPTARDAKRVAIQVLKEVASDPKGQLSASVIRKFVDADLGVKRGHAASKDKPKQMDFAEWWRSVTAALDEFTEGFNNVTLKDWRVYVRDNQTAAENLAQALRKFSEASQRVLPEFPE